MVNNLSNAQLIKGVYFEKLNRIADKSGVLFHHLNYKSPSFVGFQEVYISKTNPGIIKAWKFHKLMVQNFCVPSGRFKFVLYDGRESSETFGLINEFILDDSDNYFLLSIPNCVWYGFKCISELPGLIVNLSSLLHNPEEVIKLDIHTEMIPYKNWNDTYGS